MMHVESLTVWWFNDLIFSGSREMGRYNCTGFLTRNFQKMFTKISLCNLIVVYSLKF